MTHVEHLADALGARLRQAAGPIAALQPVLVRLLSQGQPVSVEDLAAAAGQPAADVGQALAALPDTEYDPDGRIVGHGLTLRETPHRFTVDGRQLFTWCALDTLIFPAILGQPAHIASPCPATGRPVRVTAEPDKVISVDPAEAVVSIVTPGPAPSIRAAFCDQVHYFASPEAARGWRADHPEAYLLPVTDALTLGRQLATQDG